MTFSLNSPHERLFLKGKSALKLPFLFLDASSGFVLKKNNWTYKFVRFREKALPIQGFPALWAKLFVISRNFEGFVKFFSTYQEKLSIFQLLIVFLVDNWMIERNSTVYKNKEALGKPWHPPNVLQQRWKMKKLVKKISQPKKATTNWVIHIFREIDLNLLDINLMRFSLHLKFTENVQ